MNRTPAADFEGEPGERRSASDADRERRYGGVYFDRWAVAPGPPEGPSTCVEDALARWEDGWAGCLRRTREAGAAMRLALQQDPGATRRLERAALQAERSIWVLPSRKVTPHRYATADEFEFTWGPLTDGERAFVRKASLGGMEPAS